MQNDQSFEMNIELDEQTAQGTYSNLVIISHSSSEFVFDFAALMPGVPKAKVKSRVVLAPEHAKRLLLSLQENITKYESNMGRINIEHAAPAEDSTVAMSFNMGEA